MHFSQRFLTQAAILFVPQSVSFLHACPSHAARLNAFEHVNPLGQTGHFRQIIVGVPSSLVCQGAHNKLLLLCMSCYMLCNVLHSHNP